MPKLKTTREFILDAKKLYNDRYNYSEVEYLGNKKKVIIKCKIHGNFYQTPNDHLGGHGCRKCSEENNFNYNLKDSNSEENKNKPVDLYLITLSSYTEKFLKVGISKEVKKRHQNIKTKSKYDIYVNLIIPLTVLEATILERHLLSTLRHQFKYLPKVKFPGYKECLVITNPKIIMNQIKDFLKTNHRSDLVGKILDYEYR